MKTPIRLVYDNTRTFCEELPLVRNTSVQNDAAPMKARMQGLCAHKDSMVPSDLQLELEQYKFALQALQTQFEELVFEAEFGLSEELNANKLGTFAQMLLAMQWEELNRAQRKEISRFSRSNEGRTHYIDALQFQLSVAKDFYFGRLAEGVQKLHRLPKNIRLQIDQLIWDATGGEAIDLRSPAMQRLIAAAIVHSVEMRMGMAA